MPDPGTGGFLVEEFIASITTQLDRVQDTLRLKAVNRPLTYALKELHLELKVFVDMDSAGNVRLRSTAGNEAGASLISLDFTTITKPMIEENTISLAASRSTPLDKLGLAPEERQKLERLGVTNLTQLNRLGASTGVSAVAHITDLPVDRLRRAIEAGRPKVGGVRVPPPAPSPAPSQTQPGPTRPTVPSVPSVKGSTPPFRPVVTPVPRPSPGMPVKEIRPLPSKLLMRGIAQAAADDAPNETIHVPLGARSLAVHGENFLADETPPRVRLNGVDLALDDVDQDRLVVSLPETVDAGALEIEFADGATAAFTVVPAAAGDSGADPWAPAEESGP